ncbi:MAG: ElyC/SanA/YdcF family protein [Verrucomicrobiales bacterium]
MLFGLINRRERWGLSARGWLVGLITVVAGGWGLVVTVYPFLAVTERVPAEYLVVEGWIGRPAMEAAAAEFERGGYRWAISTGGPVDGLGHYINDFQTTASVGADVLRAVGVPADRIQMAPARVHGNDRTFTAAVALREWLEEKQIDVRGMNVVTEEAHSRRTRLLYQMAFGESIPVGVISIPSADYDSRRWWESSAGVREVLAESIAYLYAKLIFRP